jgi:hypothetical protein
MIKWYYKISILESCPTKDVRKENYELSRAKDSGLWLVPMQLSLE